MNKRYEEPLVGWDEICEYMRISVPTAIKYAREYGMPVLVQGQTILAFKDELNEWRRRSSYLYGIKYRIKRRPPRKGRLLARRRNKERRKRND